MLRGRCPGIQLVGFLVSEELLLEGGAITSVFSLEEQRRITDVVIGRIHLDHSKELFFLLDNLAQARAGAVTLSGVHDIVEGIQTHLFNEQLRPDSSMLPAAKPVLVFREIPEGEFSRLGGVEVMPVKGDPHRPDNGLSSPPPGREHCLHGRHGADQGLLGGRHGGA